MAETDRASGHEEPTRRDFLLLATGAMGAVGAAAAIWPFVAQMNPARDVLALATTDVDISLIAVGQRIKVMWRGMPVFIARRTEQEIQEARAVDLRALPDPEADENRVQRDEWLVVVGVCTHLGCIPLGTESAEPLGEFGGWFCPCHGSHYDTSGRIRRGPAPLNLPVPGYEFLTDEEIRIG
jgi:ubiquinol-cytochrome c reductase iron-sulfur subunit